MKWTELSEQERDVLVASKVMRWQPKPCDLEETDEELTLYGSGDVCCPRCGAYGHINAFEHGTIPPPHYTTSMDVAWQVLQKVLDDSKGYAQMTLYHTGGYLALRIHMQDGDKDRFLPPVHVEDEMSAPKILCIAALRAVGVEIEV